MIKLDLVTFSYEYGDETFTVHTRRSIKSDLVSLDISTDGDVFTASVESSDEIVITELTATFRFGYCESDRIFLNGYQSWTDSYEHTIYDKMKGIDHIPYGIADKHAFSQYGDYTFTGYSGAQGELHGWSYGYVRTGDSYNFVGSLSEDCGFTLIRTKTYSDELIFSKDCRGLALNGRYGGLKLLLTDGKENEVFDRYFDLLGVKLRPEAKPIFGYTSWYRHYQNISSDILGADLRAMEESAHKADVFQIDDGWESVVGDWLYADHGKFPEGMQAEAKRITEAGMIPGIWLAPFVCEQNSILYMTHKSWLLQNDDGSYVKGGSNWSGFYALDIYNPDVRDYLRDVFDTVVNVWGFKLLKLDFLYAACIIPRRDKTRGQVMADAMDFLRECAGDALILACGVPLASAFGRVDYCRIGCDVSLDWDDKPYMRFAHRERISTRTTILDTVFRRQLNGRAFLSDPDVFLLRSDGCTLTTSQKMALGEVNAAAGSVLFTSDDVAFYSDEEQRLLGGFMRMRGAEVLTAVLDENELTVSYQLGEKLVTRTYKM
ncbi:MAG: alpha-galactosidase [Ruminococcus sp.]|nr:alpha-galactosidase [Ruminococcus sp.]